MKKQTRLLFVGMGLLLAGCSQNGDNMFDPATVEAEKQAAEAAKQQTNALEKLGIEKIDAQHTWVMTTQRTVRFAAFPAGFKAARIAVFDANPLANADAGYLAMAEASLGTLTYEAPTSLKTLYAACIDGDGMIRVKAFDAAAGTVDMSSTAPVVKMSAPRKVAARRLPAKHDELTWTETAHTQLGLNGWSDRETYIENGGETAVIENIVDVKAMAQSWLAEGQNNYQKGAQFKNHQDVFSTLTAKIAEEGGQISLLPVYKNSDAVEYVSYFYVRPGETLNYKACDKYVFEKKIVSNLNTVTVTADVDAYKLVYYDEQGNPSYSFPKGTQIYIFLHTAKGRPGANECVCELGRNWFSPGTMNTDMNEHRLAVHSVNANARGGLDGWKDYSRVIFFNRGGVNYVSVEDGTDFDYNDLIMMVQGDIENFPDVSDAPINPISHVYAFEDTKMGDYDMNDVVLSMKQNRNYPFVDVTLMAVGANDELYLYYKDEHGVQRLFDGKEVHEIYGVATNEFINTATINVPANQLKSCTIKIEDLGGRAFSKLDFYVENRTRQTEIHMPAALGLTGAVPFGICVPGKWAWPKERVCINKAYERFSGFAENQDVNIDWYLYPNENMVINVE